MAEDNTRWKNTESALSAFRESLKTDSQDKTKTVGISEKKDPNLPLVDFSSPQKFVNSLTENKDEINEKVDAINRKAAKAAEAVLTKSSEMIVKVLGNTGKVAGGAIALGAAGMAFTAMAATVESIVDPEAVKVLFGEAPRIAQVLSAAGASVTFTYLHAIGLNIMKEKPDPIDFKDP